MKGETLFIADLHLDDQYPETGEQFTRFLQQTASDVDALYILGDLFEAWLGDDDDNPHHTRIKYALRQLTDSGVPVYLMHGNRDFLIGEQFADQTGCKLLDECHVADLNGTSVLMMHGDLLCSEDRDYLKFRATVRHDQWQQNFLALPMTERKKIAADLRKQSQQLTSAKDEYIMDVTQATVEQYMREAGTLTLIHGHTHRPAIHDFTLDGKQAQRIVLGDWYTQGSVLRWSKKGFELQALCR